VTNSLLGEQCYEDKHVCRHQRGATWWSTSARAGSGARHGTGRRLCRVGLGVDAALTPRTRPGEGEGTDCTPRACASVSSMTRPARVVRPCRAVAHPRPS